MHIPDYFQNSTGTTYGVCRQHMCSTIVIIVIPPTGCRCGGKVNLQATRRAMLECPASLVQNCGVAMPLQSVCRAGAVQNIKQQYLGGCTLCFTTITGCRCAGGHIQCQEGCMHAVLLASSQSYHTIVLHSNCEGVETVGANICCVQ